MTAVTLGLVLAIRVGAVFYLGYLVWPGVRRSRSGIGSAEAGGAQFLRPILWLLGSVAVTILGAWATMLLFWPYRQVDRSQIQFVQSFTLHNSHENCREVYGADVLATQLPRSYLPVQFAIKTPEFLFAALSVGLAIAADLRKQTRLQHDSYTVLSIAIVTLSVIFPLGVAILLRSSVYDGIRHFLFVLPSLAVLAGVGFSRFIAIPVAPFIRAAALVTSSGWAG